MAGVNLIFNEYLTFLRETSGQELSDIKEGYFWLDRLIIKGFDKQGNVHKFYKVKVSDDLEIVQVVKLKKYENIADVDLASWNDLIELNKEHLQQIENKSLQLIQDKMEKYKEYTPLVPVSMGKDSMLTCHLVRELFPDVKAIFNNTTLDCADVYRIVKEFPNCEFMNPKEGFYQYIKKHNIIFNRISRGCCRIFKVGEMVNRLDHDYPYLLFMGMRNEESNTRSTYEDEWINKQEWGKTSWQGILPIREWTEMDLWLYTLWKNIPICEKYKKGYQRVGCAIACAYAAKSTWILDKYWYPKQYDRWRNILREDFLNNQKWIVMNCTLKEYLTQAWSGGVFRDEPTQEVINEFCEYTGISPDVADQYFNKYCDSCEKKKRIKDKEVLSMNMKMHGRNTNKFYCKKCLMKEFEWTSEEWNKQIDLFKQQGCALF